MKILAVEDEYLSRFLFRSMLESLGHEVVACATGTEAWSRIEGENFRMVVSDWRLPGLDGLELCRRIRTREGDYVYFILVTGADATEQNETTAIEAGVDDFLGKPVTPRELRNRLRVAERILTYTTQLRQLESFLPSVVIAKKSATTAITGYRSRAASASARARRSVMASARIIIRSTGNPSCADWGSTTVL